MFIKCNFIYVNNFFFILFSSLVRHVEIAFTVRDTLSSDLLYTMTNK